jgi:hypothetical protein
MVMFKIVDNNTAIFLDVLLVFQKASILKNLFDTYAAITGQCSIEWNCCGGSQPAVGPLNFFFRH